MMTQSFFYPNLVSGTRKEKLGFASYGVTVTKAHMSDDVVGDYERFTVTDNKYGKPYWAYAYIYANLSAVLALPSGNECTSVFAARASEHGFVPTSFFLTARDGNGTKEIFARMSPSVIGIGGGVVPLRYQTREERRREVEPGPLHVARWPEIRCRGNHRHRAACDIPRNHAPRVGTGCWGGVA